MKRSGRSTGCAVPGLPDPSTLRDEHAERLVVYGLLHDHEELAPRLAEAGFGKGDFYWSPHQKLFDLALYVHNGGVNGPIMADVFEEGVRRRELCDCPTGRDFCLWLVSLWHTDPWLSDIRQWADMSYDSTKLSLFVWAALAAATKVKHLASRRAALFAASEVIRNALSPTGGADEIDRSVGDIHGEEYG